MSKARNPPSDRETSTWFAMETYVPVPLLEEWLDEEYDCKIRHYAYIHHDKDACEPHTHYVINTVKEQTVETVRNWLYRFASANGCNQNTLGKILGNAEAMARYLTHSDEKSIKAGKHQYDPAEVVTDSPEWFNDKTAPRNGHRDIQQDKTMDIIDAIIRGDSFRDMVARFGRDFVINYRYYQTMATLIYQEEGEETENEVDGNLCAVGAKIAEANQRINEMLDTIA